MGPSEVALRARKKLYEFQDARSNRWPSVDLSTSRFPKLPDPSDAPASIRDALKCDAERVAAGRLRFFGHLDVDTGTPPDWQRDHLAKITMPTEESAFKLNHRELPDGASINHCGSQAAGLVRCAWPRPVGCLATVAVASIVSIGLRIG